LPDKKFTSYSLCETKYFAIALCFKNLAIIFPTVLLKSFVFLIFLNKHNTLFITGNIKVSIENEVACAIIKKGMIEEDIEISIK
jgi:hypothetical protein